MRLECKGCRLALETRGSGGMTNWAEWGCRWTHSASGTVTQGKQCSGSHLVATGEKRGHAERRSHWIEEEGGGGGGGGREGLQRAQAYGKADFSSPCSGGRRRMSQHAPRPRLTVPPHSAPPPGPPCSATECGQQRHGGAFVPRGAQDCPHVRTHVHQHLPPALVHARDTQRPRLPLPGIGVGVLAK